MTRWLCERTSYAGVNAQAESLCERAMDRFGLVRAHCALSLSLSVCVCVCVCVSVSVCVSVCGVCLFVRWSQII
jgi:hypothetical protein